MAKAKASIVSTDVGNAGRGNGSRSPDISGNLLDSFSVEFIQPWAESTSKITSVAMDCCAEAIRFAGQRFERNRETVSHLPKCGSWDEVLELQMNWTSGLMHDYLEESRNFFEIAKMGSAEVAKKHGNGRPKV